MTLGVRALIHDRERGTIFLIRHTYMPGWQLPGGGVERGETLEDALRRETFEEGNIEILGQPELKSVHFNRQASQRDHVALYLVTQFVQSSAKVRDREIAEAGFFPLDALPPDTTPGTRRRIAEVLEGKEVAADW